MMDSGLPFWAEWCPGGIGSSTRYRTIPLIPNMDGDTYGPLGDIRWRHRENNGLNVIFGDGHAATQIPMSLTEDNFVPTDWHSNP